MVWCFVVFNKIKKLKNKILRHNDVTDSEFRKAPFHVSVYVLFKITTSDVGIQKWKWVAGTE